MISVRPQDPGQLGDVRLLDPAPLVCALTVAAGIVGAALTHLVAVIDGDLPRALGDQSQRGGLEGALARAEPKTLRYSILDVAARLTRGGRRRQLKRIATTWP